MLLTLFWLSLLFIFYTYIGYPVLIAILAKNKSNNQKGQLEIPKLSVTLLITAYNEESVILKKIENSLLLDYDDDLLQILVAADGSTDQTPDIVKRFSERVDLAYIPQRGGKMAAINRAMPFVRGDIIVFSDANNMYDQDALQKLIAPFSDFTVGATTGAKLIIQDSGDLSNVEGFYWKYESWIKKNQTILGTCTSSVGEMLAVRRDCYVAPPENIINDDYYIVIDLIKRGFRVCYVPEARSLEYISATERDEIIRRSRISTGHFQAISMASRLLPFNRPKLVWHILSHKFARALLPFGFIGIFVSNLFLVFFPASVSNSVLFLTRPYSAILLGLQLIFYITGVVGYYIKFPGLIGKMVYLCTYLLISNFALLKGFWGFITKKQTNIWQRVRRDTV